jgi:YVTN family beta-propeller protein
MQGSDSKRSAAYWARGFIILGAALGLGLSARPAAAAPFAYVSNSSIFGLSGGAVSVIDTGAKPPAVVATVGVGIDPTGVAVTPDGKHAYVANHESGTVSVIDAATNTVVATIPIVGFPITTPNNGVAITPDGKYAYLTVGNR